MIMREKREKFEDERKNKNKKWRRKNERKAKEQNCA